MKTGRTLNELAAELTRQSESRKDYIAPQGKLEAVVADDDKVVKIAGVNGDLVLTNYAHGQLADHLGIPKKYYDRMAIEQPEALAFNINTWLKADPNNKRMLRTLDGKVRAVLSPKFRALDNFDLGNAVLPVLVEHKVQIMSCELTETRMYIKGILPELSDALPEGLAYGTGHNAIARDYGRGPDRGRVVAAITISNSDIGAGTLRVEPSVFTTWCTNLAILAQAAMKKFHAGRANSADDETWQVFHDDTRRADDAAFWLKVRDITMAAFDEKMFRAAVEQMKRAAGKAIESDDLPTVVDAVVEQLALPPAMSGGILKALAAGGDLTQWGLSSAITRVANDVDDYEMATLLERAGGQVIALPDTDWKRIAA
jgi:hypothetical protein